MKRGEVTQWWEDRVFHTRVVLDVDESSRCLSGTVLLCNMREMYGSYYIAKYDEISGETTHEKLITRPDAEFFLKLVS